MKEDKGLIWAELIDQECKRRMRLTLALPIDRAREEVKERFRVQALFDSISKPFEHRAGDLRMGFDLPLLRHHLRDTLKMAGPAPMVRGKVVDRRQDESRHFREAAQGTAHLLSGGLRQVELDFDASETV